MAALTRSHLRIRGGLSFAVCLAANVAAWAAPAVLAGDIVFQTSRSSQSQAIQLATHSPYSHMGMVVFRSGKPFVLEAAGAVKLTPLDEWIARGVGETIVVKRLKDAQALATPQARDKLEKAALAFLGRPYDPWFDWSDDRMYCSELVWKAYHRGLGIKIGDLTRMSDLDLSSPRVKSKMKQRWGNDIPTNEKVISPAAMFSSPLLETVH